MAMCTRLGCISEAEWKLPNVHGAIPFSSTGELIKYEYQFYLYSFTPQFVSQE